MKKFLKILAIIASFIVVIIIFVGIATKPMVNDVKQFLTEASSGDINIAIQYFSEVLRDQVGDEKLLEVMSHTAIQNYEEVSFNSKSISGKGGELIGTITTKTGGVANISMNMVKENDMWKISSIYIN